MRHILTVLIIALTGAIAAAQVQGPVPVERVPERVLVLPFEQLDPEPQHAWLSRAIHRTLLVDLAELPRVVPVTLPSDQAAQLDRQDREALAEAAGSVGARLILSGTYQIVAEQIRLTATLLDIEREAPVAAMRTTADLEELFELQDALGEHVRLLLHEFDPALVEEDRLPVPVYPPAVEYRPPPAPIYEPYYEPPPSYVYVPTHHHHFHPPRVHCPIWHPAPFRTTTFFFIVKSKPKPEIPHRHWEKPPVVKEIPTAPTQTHARLPNRPGRPIQPDPVAITPRLTPNPPEIVADAPQPPANNRNTEVRQARRPGRRIEHPPRLEAQPERTITIAPRPAPQPPAIQPPIQPPPERTITIPPRSAPETPRLTPERPAVIMDAPRPPQPARPAASSPPRLTPNQPAIVADSPRAPEPPRAAASPPRLTPNQPAIVADAPRAPSEPRSAPAPAARPAPALARPAPEPQPAPEQPARGRGPASRGR